ncbi:hypothetical protein B0H17DRAFT_1136286 [Mycena rosella]|uniref:Uncharacterized protein n=1 Tax=Mycena rosella TaxID=1033263 RepID=A0AAD7DBF2_MYCRO|nr:hypothetical protein B0H17DRAFT_1136286 [Mycena rosella]
MRFKRSLNSLMLPLIVSAACLLPPSGALLLPRLSSPSTFKSFSMRPFDYPARPAFASDLTSRPRLDDWFLADSIECRYPTHAAEGRLYIGSALLMYRAESSGANFENRSRSAAADARATKMQGQWNDCSYKVATFTSHPFEPKVEGKLDGLDRMGMM